MREKRGGTKTSFRTRSKPKTGSRPRRRAVDWERVDATTDAEIGRQIKNNPDDIEFTDEVIASARWVMPEKKIPISFRVDPDVLAYFRIGGNGYQSRMNSVLRAFMKAAKASTRRGRKSGGAVGL